MSDTDWYDQTQPADSIATRIDLACDELEAAWKRKEQPQIERYLVRFPESDCPRVLRELLLVELAYRRCHEEPQLEEYRKRFPGHADVIEAVFRDFEAMSHGSGEFRSVGTSSSGGSRFQIVRFHKEGGLGQVWVARDQELHRDVALKDIKARHADVPEFRSRFVAEAEITGGLEHPGVVPVYGLGQYDDGRPFYVMRFIRGDTLADAIERFHARGKSKADSTERALELRKLLGRFVDVCNAIEYAHSRGVLHRDLKPGNIMLGEYGETLVVDWGLAKVLDQLAGDRVAAEGAIRPTVVEGSVPTQVGSAIGTPQYMSPEQAAGRLDQMGPATDVYSLGATLYCLLTGRPPLAGQDVATIIENVQEGSFPRPREVYPAVPRALEAICLKAMARQPADRYGSPRQLAEEVERWLADEPVAALRETWPERLSRWARRNRTWVRAGAAALVLVTVVSIISAVLIDEQRQNAERQREKANQLASRNAQLAVAEKAARQLFQRQLDRARRNLYAFQLSNVEQAAVEDPGRALILLGDGETCRKALREFAWAYYYRVCRRDRLTWRPHPEGIRLAAFADEGETLATVGADGAIKLWNGTTGELLTELKTEQAVTAAAMSANGRWLATANQDGSIQLWDVPARENRGRLAGQEAMVRYLSLSGKGEILLALGEGEVCPIAVWDVPNRKLLGTLDGPTRTAALAVSPNLAYAAAGGEYEHTAKAGYKLWSLPQLDELYYGELGEQGGPELGERSRIDCVEFTPDSESLVVGSRIGTLGVLPLVDVDAQEVLKPLAHAGTIASLAVHPKENIVVTAGPGHWLRLGINRPYQPVVVWNTAQFERPLTYLAVIQEEVVDVAFSTDGSKLATVGINGVLRVFQFSEYWEDWRSTRLRHHGQVDAAAFSPDGKTLVAVVGDDQGNLVAVEHWDPILGAPLEAPAFKQDNVVLVLPDGQTLDRRGQPSDHPHNAEVVDALSAQVLGKLPLGPREHVKAISPDGRLLAVTSGHELKIWDLSSPRLRRTFAVEDDAPRTSPVAFSPNGELLAWGSGLQPGRVALWNLSSGAEVGRIDGLPHAVGALAFSPNGATLAIGLGQRLLTLPELPMPPGAPFDVILWDVATQKPRTWLRGHGGAVYSVAFSPDGKTLATGSFDNTVRLWDPQFGIQLATLDDHHGTVFSVSFSPDGRTLATASFDRTVRLWRGATDEMVAEREAMSAAISLVDWATNSFPLKAEVIRQIREHTSISDQERKLALRLAEGLTDDPRQLNDWSWLIVRRPDADPAEYAKALRCAQAACRLGPDDSVSLNTLGLAQYRNGDFPAALETLKRSRKLFEEATGQTLPADLAFIAMTHFQLGEPEKARATLEELEQVLKQPIWSQSREFHNFWREATALITGNTPDADD